MFLILTLCGCKTITTQLREEGFNRQWEAYERINGQPAEHTAEIRVRVIVTQDLGYYRAAGLYLHPAGIIKVMGKMVDGKIVISETVLGHEVLHALQYQDGHFVNPDKLQELGY